MEGVVATQVTYLDKEENGAIRSTTFDIPFTYEIEVPGMREDVTYSIVPFIDQVTAMQVSDNQLEMKAEVSLDVLAFTNEHTRVVTDMESTPVNYERKKSLPGVIGYVVKKDDSLWSIAKKYYTTVAQIKSMNDMESDDIAPGERLVILKE